VQASMRVSKAAVRRVAFWKDLSMNVSW